MGRTTIRGEIDVLSATQKRIAYLFDNYDNISLSFSGGKDSTALFHLVNEEAKRRDRKFILYFQDQEAEYQGTIDMMEWAMTQPNVIPLWYQVPIFMTNTASQQQLFLWAWGEGEKWVRDKHPIAIHSIGKKYPLSLSHISIESNKMIDKKSNDRNTNSTKPLPKKQRWACKII